MEKEKLIEVLELMSRINELAHMTLEKIETYVDDSNCYDLITESRDIEKEIQEKLDELSE